MEHKFKIRTAVEKVVEAESVEEVYDIAEVYMNRTKKLVLAAGLTLLGGTAAFGENMAGEGEDGARPGFSGQWLAKCIRGAKGCEQFLSRAHAAIASRERNVALRSVIASTVARRQCMPASLQRAATTDLHADSTVPDPM